MEIRPYPQNAKKHPRKHIEQVAASIKEFGMHQPIVVDKEGVIIVGHGRYEALKELGWSEEEIAKYVKVADLTEEQAKAYRLADNKLNESEWDMGLVLEDLKELSPELFDLTGFDRDLLIEPDEKDDIIPEDAPTRAKLGDVWALGRHRVMCGDSTDKDAVARLMEGKQADMVFTDPPYNVDYGGEQSPIWKKSVKKIENDNLTASGWVRFCEDISSVIEEFNSGALYVCHAPGPDGRVIASILDKTFHWSATIIWKKDRLIPGRASFQRQYEPIWYGWKGEHKEQVDRKATDVWEVKRPFKNDLHPTMKPVELIERAIMYSSFDSQTILDLFLGSGSTLIASEKTNRICYGMEIDPKYVDVIIKRWEDYTGKTAEKL